MSAEPKVVAGRLGLPFRSVHIQTIGDLVVVHIHTDASSTMESFDHLLDALDWIAEQRTVPTTLPNNPQEPF